jgi:hypothetical protein
MLGMLETPLFGRFQGEGRKLAFLPPAIYLTLVRVVAIAGVIFFLNGSLFWFPMFYPAWWHLVGVLLLGAAALASLSLHSVVFNLKEGTYRRRQGPGMFPKTTVGSLKNLDAVVLIAEPNASLVLNGVTYHLVLHWKNQAEPSMLLQSDTRSLGTGQPLNAAAANIQQVGIRYAQSLGVPFYDNAHFAGSNPAPLLRR